MDSLYWCSNLEDVWSSACAGSTSGHGKRKLKELQRGIARELEERGRDIVRPELLPTSVLAR